MLDGADLAIGNRRYAGSKRALLNDIYENIAPYQKQGAVFADLFAGTGIVSHFMLEKGLNVITNDILRSNYIAHQAWFGHGKFDIRKLGQIISEFNSINGKILEDNYFSNIYGGKYFSISDARKIGFIRERIANIRLTERERNILLASLMYATDRIANTVGHFEHFLAKPPVDKDIILRLPRINNFRGQKMICNMDANKLVHNINCDVAYIDPPYNARQYVNFYHVLENLIRWNKPTEFEGISMKFKRDELKSDYSKAKAPKVFKDLINNLRAKLIIVSYNNTYSAKSNASNNKISENQLTDILLARGRVKIKEIKHKFFNSGKTEFKNHKELLYICEPI